MAEFEPVGGPAGTGVESAPAETAPVEGTPVAIGAPAGSPPTARPRGLLRWGVALIALAVMVGVVSVAVAMLASGGGASSVQGWLPKGTVAYLEIRADLPGDQRAKVGDILARFPGFADQASNDAKIDEALDRLLSGSGSSWSRDIKPWVGGEVGLALTKAAFDLANRAQSGETPAAMPDDGFALLVAVKDADAAKAWLSKRGTLTTETYAGGELTMVIYGPARNVYAFAIRKNVLILGPAKAVKAALDTAGSSPVATTESFAAAHKTAPEAYLGFGYLDMKAFWDFTLEMAKKQGGTSAACLPDAAATIPGWLAGSARAEDGALVFTSTNPTAGTPPAAKSSASGAASHLPGTTVAAIQVRDLGPSLVGGMAALKAGLACDPATASAFTQIEQALAALGGADALIGWAGDAALAVTVDGSTLGGGLAAVATDEGAASRTLDQVRTLLALGGAQAGVQTRDQAYGEAKLLVITIPAGAGMPEIAATVHGGIFALGTIDFVKAVVDTRAGSSLADDAVYTRAVGRAGGSGVASLFVDIAGLRAGIEAMLPADQKARYESEIKPFIEPFEAFAAVIEAPTTTTVTRTVITFTK